MIHKKMGLIVLLISVAGCSTMLEREKHDKADYALNQTSQFYESFFIDDKPNIAKLNLFFTNMPKGGDLHHHYTGTIYAETYLDWVEKKEWYINSCTLKTTKTNENGKCPSLTISQLIENDTLYRKLLTLWSDKDYGNHSHEQLPPDTTFFNTFGYFNTISNEYMATGLNILKQRAIKENVSYIETMLTRVGVKSEDYFPRPTAKEINSALRSAQSFGEINKILNQIVKHVKANKNFESEISAFISMVQHNHKDIDDDIFVMRYQTYAVRVLDPLQVFIDLFSGYLAANKSPLIVGVNIVAPENNSIALADYTLHMQMYKYLHEKFPTVNRALHAGELTLGMVRPKDLGFHIKQARDIASAQRIGHGIDLPYEQNSETLLKDLKNNSAIEINLTSNEFILGVMGNEHPYLIYSSYGVPLVISTDDSGVSRNNLSNEYMLLASRYHPTYKTIKKYVFNSIKYSFLSQEDKLSAKKLLTKKFSDFEQNMSTLFSVMN